MAEEQTLRSSASDVTAEAPQITSAIVRTPDGRWQSTLSVSFQVTSTWGPADDSIPSPTQRKPSEGDTGTGGSTKAGVGVERKSRGSDGDNQPPDDTKTGIGAELKHTEAPPRGRREGRQ